VIKKPFQILIIFSFIIFCLSEIGYPASKFGKPRFFIKFRGNINVLDGGTFQNMIDEDLVYFETLKNSGGDYVIGTDEDPFFTGYGAEIGIEAGKYAVSLDIGFLAKKYLIDYQYRDNSTGYELQYNWEQTFSAVPIFIYNYLKIIDGSAITSYITLGGGMYLAKISSLKKESFLNGELTFQNTSLEGKRNFLGLHLGASLELSITKNIGIFVEAMYRYVSFKNFTGTQTYEYDGGSTETEGDVIYLVFKDSGKGYFWIGEYNTEDFEELPVEMNMRGFALTAGIKIIFGSRAK
jgi:hypothetical protein